MKKLIIIFAIVLFSATAWAADPILVCDDPPPEQQVTAYEVFQDGVSLGITPAPLAYNLKDIVPGQYTFTAKAINAWGSSSPSNPYISPASATPPSNLNIAP